MQAVRPAAAFFALAVLLALLAIAPAPARARELHDELRWTEGFHVLPPPAKPAQTQPAARPRPKPLQVASAQHLPRRR